MLRKALIAIAAVLLLCAAGAILAGFVASGLAAFLVWSALVLVAVLAERYRYKTILTSAPGPDWERTAERFVDPATKREVTVYFQPSTGKRAYVSEAERA